MKKIILLLSAILMIGFYSCKTDKTKTKTSKTERVIAKKTDAEVKTDIENLLHEMDAAWNKMMQADDQKLDDLQELHAKIGRSKNYEKEAFRNLIAGRENLKKIRYDRAGIKNVAAVDAYDSAQVKVLDETNALIEQSNITKQDSITAQLYERIQEEDSRVPMRRSDYDEAAKKFNQYLLDYKPQLQKLGAPYNALERAPLFGEF